ncbi:MAG: hypothetical protein V7L23_18995 [Nostoc sp.]
MNVSLNPPLRPLHFSLINLVRNTGNTVRDVALQRLYYSDLLQ